MKVYIVVQRYNGDIMGIDSVHTTLDGADYQAKSMSKLNEAIGSLFTFTVEVHRLWT